MKLSEYINKYGDCEINEEKAKELIVERKERWKPEIGEGYWCISDDGYTRGATWAPFRLHQRRHDLGNCFKTKEEAEFELEKRKVLVELQDYANLHNECEIDWRNKNQPKYVIGYRLDRGLLIPAQNEMNNFIDIGQIYFTSDKIARNAFESVGVGRIKKYLLGVD